MTTDSFIDISLDDLDNMMGGATKAPAVTTVKGSGGRLQREKVGGGVSLIGNRGAFDHPTAADFADMPR